jgi:predicted nucleotidyltransferase
MKQDVFDICRAELTRMPDVQFAVVYGSCAHGTMTARSDADIGVAGPRAIDLAARAELSAQLSMRLGRDVDVIDLRSVSGVILQEALCTGRIVLARDKELYASLMTKMLYNQADMMPYYRRILSERRERFLHES